MQSKTIYRLLACAAVSILSGPLAGCGGGEGTGQTPVAAVPTPGPSPTPPPSQVFDTVAFALGQSAGFTYSVLGYRVAVRPGPFDNIPDPTTIDPAVPFGLTHAGAGQFRLSIGGLGEGPLVPNGGGGTASGDGRTTQFSFNALGGGGSIGEALSFEARPLSATAWGYLSVTTRPPSLDNAYDYPFLYGVPTESTAVATTGVAEFRSCCDTTHSAVRIDYASGTVTATRLGDGMTFTDVALGADRTTFSGRFAGKDGEGTVEGRFTGFDGRELMLRMIVPGKAAHLIAMRKVDLPGVS